METEIPINDEEIKQKVQKRLGENGSLKRMEEEFQFGMIIAIDDIRNNTSDKSIEHKPFNDTQKGEVKALQGVLQFLSKNGFAFTLSCLLDESNSALDAEAEEIDIKSLEPLEPLTKRLEPSYNIEPPKTITKKDFNASNVIISVDEL